MRAHLLNFSILILLSRTETIAAIGVQMKMLSIRVMIISLIRHKKLALLCCREYLSQTEDTCHQMLVQKLQIDQRTSQDHSQTHFPQLKFRQSLKSTKKLQRPPSNATTMVNNCKKDANVMGQSNLQDYIRVSCLMHL